VKSDRTLSKLHRNWNGHKFLEFRKVPSILGKCEGVAGQMPFSATGYPRAGVWERGVSLFVIGVNAKRFLQ